MRNITRQDFEAALRKVGINQGDNLLVHSALQFLGVPEGGIAMYLKSIISMIGANGTLAVPTFNFAFAGGESYDPLKSPSSGMGAFSEFIRQQPGARRTMHPMQSMAVMGYCTDDLADRDTPSAFDTGSAFERMLELDFRILLLGADINAISLLHYSEQHNNVPYRYWKDFSGDVMTSEGWQYQTYRMFVRDMDIDPKIDLKPVKKLLQQRGLWDSTSVNYGNISLCTAIDFVEAVDYFLIKDPWSLVTNYPE